MAADSGRDIETNSGSGLEQDSGKTNSGSGVAADSGRGIEADSGSGLETPLDMATDCHGKHLRTSLEEFVMLLTDYKKMT